MAQVVIEIADDARYTSTDGKFSFPLVGLHPNTWLNGLIRSLNHATGNEAISKGSTAKTKAVGSGGEFNATFTEAMYDGIILETREKLHKAMEDGSWGDTSTRGPRMPAANRREAIFNQLLAEAARNAIAKMGLKPVDGQKNTWLTPKGQAFTLEQGMALYRDNPELGAERVAALNKAADAKYASEMEQKANKVRDAGVKADVEGEFVL